MGRRIGDYRLLERLGEGGHGEVYRAVHRDQPDQPVALKVVRAALQERAALARALRRECAILARLDHPGIVRVLDAFEAEGRPVLVMALLEGEDLLQRLKRHGGPLPWPEVDAILLGALEALDHAHTQGVLHRDLKPANVFCSPSGHITLTDFGVARIQAGALPEADLTLTQSTTHGLKGTLGYMAPERFAGTSAPAGDVYALGLVAWELLAGRRACPEGDLPTRMRWHLEEGPTPLSREAPDVPGWLATLVQAMVCSEPEVRPQDAGQVLRLRERLRAPLLPLRAPTFPAAPASQRGAVLDLVPLLGVAPRTLPEVVAYVGLALPLGTGLILGGGLPWRGVAGGLAVGWAGLLWRRRAVLGGGLWALLWVPLAVAVAAWGDGRLWAVALGAAICAGALWAARRHRWPASALEVAAWLLGMGVLSVQLWLGLLTWSEGHLG